MIQKPYCFLVLLSPLFAAKATSTMLSTSLSERDVYTPPDLNAMTSDARQWYLKGVSNGEKNLDKFQPIVNSITAGKETWKPFLKIQLAALLSQAEEANENTKILVPKLNGFIDDLASWSQNPISCWSKLKIKAAIWYIDGKRDNKSYYLQNGAGLWCKLRVEKYLKPVYETSATAMELGNELETLGQDLLFARDELDNTAQVYVQAMKKLVVLVSDVGANQKEIEELTKDLQQKGNKSKDGVLKSAQDSVDKIKEKILSL